MHRNSAAEVAKRRITIASRRLGTRNPVEAIDGLLDRSFPLPLGDPRYQDNHLTPGYLPIEHSFSEVAPEAFRLDLQPLAPGASPEARRNEASREARRLVHEGFGSDALRWFDQRSEHFRGAIHGGARFGAWFGMGVDEAGLQETKVYYELRPGDLDGLPPNLLHAAQTAMACLPGLVPIFTSIACGRKQGAQRLYFRHAGDLRLLDLEPLLRRLGIGSQLPSLLSAVGVVLGGRFILPEGSVILGLRDTSRGLELKLDVLIGGVPEPPAHMYRLLEMVLAERPRSQRAMRHWARAMTPDDSEGPGYISVVSFRVRPDAATRTSVYLRPNGYDQVGRSVPGPGSESRYAHTPQYA
jgi:hypothetical protein